MYSTNPLKPPSPPGHHLGPEPSDPTIRSEAQRARAAGFDTCTSTHYTELLDEDVDLAWLRGLA